MAEGNKLKTRAEIEEKYKWKVQELYNTDEAWEEDFKKLKKEAVELSKYQGTLHEGESLLKFLEAYEEKLRLFENLAVYSHLRKDEDTSNSKYQVMNDKISVFGAELSGIISFFIPELLSFQDGIVEKMVKETKGLKHYEIMLKRIMEEKPHVLSEAEEKILASVSDCLNAPDNIYIQCLLMQI